MSLACRKCGCSPEEPCLLTRNGTLVTDEAIANWTDEQIQAFDGGCCFLVEPDLCSTCVENPPPPLLSDENGEPIRRGAP